VSLAIAGSSLLYAIYRAYYGFGGTAGMVGRVTDQSVWHLINLAAAGMLLVVAALPLAALPLWRSPSLRRVLLALCWAVAVGVVMHALIDDTQRVLSLAGVLDIRYPASLWASMDTNTADIQDLVFNETWFLAEGLLWGALAVTALGSSRARRWWLATAAGATALMTAFGLLSAFGVIGRAVVV
jgi:hypothetical protein